MRFLVWSTVLLGLCAGCVTPGGVDDAAPDASTPSGYRLDCSVAATSGASWPEPCLAFASPNDSPSKTEIDLVVNPNDPDNVIVASKDIDPTASPCVWAVAQASLDGGESWTTSIIGGPMADRQPGELLWGWNCITDPIMAFDADGTVYYSLQLYDHTLEGSAVTDPTGMLPIGFTFGSSIMAVQSTDGGLTWSEPIVLHLGDGSTVFHDYMRVLVNPATQTYHTIWNQFNSAGPAGVVVPVLVALEQGATAARAPVYFPVTDAPTGTTMAGFAAATDGTMYAILDAGSDGYFASSADDGQTWSAPVLVPQLNRVGIARQAMGDEAFRTTGSYELVVDTSGGERDGWLYATISDCADDDCNVLVTRSEDGGATWSDPVLVNDGERKPGFQWMPRPTVDRLGNVHIVYYDTSRNVDTNLIDASWAVSTDGGATWTNTVLTATAFDGNLGIHQDGFPFIGDYLGIGTAGDWLYMGFPTTVTGRAEIAVAKVALP